MPNSILVQRREQMFPKLTAAQIARLTAHGHPVETSAGQVLLEAGERARTVYVVIAGSLELLMPHDGKTELLYLLMPGDFTGEMSALRGSAGFVRIRVLAPGSLIALDVEQLKAMVQTDAELSELFMRAFILRRMAIMFEGHSEVLLLGSSHSADTLRLREFLDRNLYPHANIDIDTDADVQALFDRFHVQAQDVPVVICRDRIFKNPSNHDIAECLGINPQLDDERLYDLLIVGAGPAGLAAAVYAASEGLSVRMVETVAPGGQAASSSKIENYLGFPTGISGRALAGRALSQAQKFGASISVAARAVTLECARHPYVLTLEDGKTVQANIVLIASGAQYRALEIESLPRFLGNGVYYAATHLEAKLCDGKDIVIVGGGNSAGQAAVFLSNSCRRVHMLVRATGLVDSMSNYLIRRIEETPNITLHTRTEVTALEGDDRLQRIHWRHALADADEPQEIAHLFLMTGASPNTEWLRGCVALDEHGFVKTGPDLQPAELDQTRWSLERSPFLLETNLPGVFAVGDVRHGSVKRVAAAVGEGSSCVQFIHRVLHEMSRGRQKSQ